MREDVYIPKALSSISSDALMSWIGIVLVTIPSNNPPVYRITMNRIFFYEASEYLRPWKLLSLFLGIVLLVLGSYYTPAPDWDIPISFIMALFAYLTAPWSMRVLLTRQWIYWPPMAFITWFSVDGCYAIYWYVKDPLVLASMREANLPASLALYGLCGAIWLYRGSLSELLSGLRGLLKQ